MKRDYESLLRKRIVDEIYPQQCEFIMEEFPQ